MGENSEAEDIFQDLSFYSHFKKVGIKGCQFLINHSFIQHVFIDHLICAQDHSNHYSSY